MKDKVLAKIRSFAPQVYWREILAILILVLAIFFFKNERHELTSIIPQLEHAKVEWLVAALCLTAICILLQAGMYVRSFAALGLHLKWNYAVALFLKRNFLSVFLPAGGVSSLAYTPSEIRKEGFNRTGIHLASAFYGFTGILSLVISGIPVIALIVIQGNSFNNALAGFVVIIAAVACLILIVRDIRHKGKVYQLIERRMPSLLSTVDELLQTNVDKGKMAGTLVFSLGVDLSCMVHVYFAMLALGVEPSFAASASAYMVSMLLAAVSPFLRGLGAVELCMVYVLQQFGYTSAQALSITILYRVFEFWLPLMAGILAFFWKGRNLFLRLFPAVATFGLGIINIISVITPPLRPRLHLVLEYLPLSAIHASNMLVFLAGLGFMIVAAYLFRGLRTAWLITLVLSIVSLMGHLTKALDYEEACVALVNILLLVATSSQYYIKSSRKWRIMGLTSFLLCFGGMLVLGFCSFYFIDKVHFGVDFTWRDSLIHTARNFLFLGDPTLQPLTRFGQEFLVFMRCLGFLAWAALLLALIRPYVLKPSTDMTQREKAFFLIHQFGSSSLDYFKTYKDKVYYFSEAFDGFVAYRVANDFAIVLEEPVCDNEDKTGIIEEFDAHCRACGLKSAYYRVDENSLLWFDVLKKQKLVIGQEAIVDVTKFNIDEKRNKSLRNAMRGLEKKNCKVDIIYAPHTNEFLEALRKVSDTWLESFDKKEVAFADGMFDIDELRQQDIVVLTDETNEIKAFLNIIPDYAENECTYDMIRKTMDAPNGVMDALILKVIDYAKERNKKFINLGMAPMTGITEPQNTPEQIIKLAASRIKSFQHYKGLRDFKDKYATYWVNKYLVYNSDFDLLNLPVAINHVMKP